MTDDAHIGTSMSDSLKFYRVPVETLFEASFKGFQSRIGRTNRFGETYFEQYENVHRIFITLEGRTRSTVAEVDDLPTVRRPDQPGTVTIVPAGVKRRVLLEDIDFLVLSMGVSDEFLRLCGEDDERRSLDETPQPPILQNIRNDWLLRTAQAYRRAGAGGASSMLIQTLAFAMVRHLARSGGRVSESGGLDPYALTRVLQLMQDRLAQDLTLTELAAEAGLSVSAFSRAFAKSLGAAPYRYFTALRMQRAKELLAHSNEPLASIAGEAGYADQAHFTAAFTRHTGFSPGRWRSEFGSIQRFVPISRKTELRQTPYNQA